MREPADNLRMSEKDQRWYTPLLVFCLVSIALLAAMADQRSAAQTSFAVLAVFFGAVTILRSDFSAWFRGQGSAEERGMDASLTGCGVLVIAVGAAFLLT